MKTIEQIKKYINDSDMVLVGIGNEEWENGQRELFEKILEGKNHYIINEDMTEENNGWSKYSMWLMGSMNRKICIIESDVSMERPDRIRWPFERIAVINQKAIFIRINKKLPYIPVELKDRGIGIAENAMDILSGIC